MTYFKLDIPKLSEQIYTYRYLKKASLEDLGFVYSGLGYTESAWNDNNSKLFLDIVKNDKYKVEEYFNYLDSIYDEIDKFKVNIDNICYKQGYKTSSVILKFDDTDMESCRKNLTNAIDYLKTALDNLDITAFPDNFEYMDLLYELKDGLSDSIKIINTLGTDIANFLKDINNEIEDSKYRMGKISSYDFNLKPLKYTWSMVDIDTKQNDKIIEQYNALKNSKEVENIVSQKSINLEDIDKVSGLHNGYEEKYADEKNIWLEDIDKVSGLHNGYAEKYADEKNIWLEDIDKVSGLHNGYEEKYGTEQDINLQKQEKINNLGEDTYSTNDNTINYDNIFGDFKLNDDSININENKTNIDTSNLGMKDFEYSGNIDNYDVNSNTINYTASSPQLDVSGIKPVELNSTNIDTSNIGSSNLNFGESIKTFDASDFKIDNNIGRDN